MKGFIDDQKLLEAYWYNSAAHDITLHHCTDMHPYLLTPLHSELVTASEWSSPIAVSSHIMTRI